MDEAEALGDKVMVMTTGQMLCYSTLGQLKSAHSKGLYIDMMMKTPTDLIAKLKEQHQCGPTLNAKQVKDMTKTIFEGKLSWNKLRTFGNGHILHEQLMGLKRSADNSEQAEDEIVANDYD